MSWEEEVRGRKKKTEKGRSAVRICGRRPETASGGGQQLQPTAVGRPLAGTSAVVGAGFDFEGVVMDLWWSRMKDPRLEGKLRHQETIILHSKILGSALSSALCPRGSALDDLGS
ncbi:hypothetical protein Syun_010818 [Stephania yunnanensis]|uniref:Uncharacterized protein n=1 Tax=Stephania yunnanensis TaxID=152371 RepID=A0AAP0KIZ5_9MAGN